MPALRPRAKRTLNVLYRLTTEMGEGRGWENREQYRHAHPGKDDIRKNVRPADHRNVAPAKAQKGIKLIYCPWGGIWIILALPKSVQHYTKRWSYWVVILNLLKIKYLDKSFIIIMWHTLSDPMAVQFRKMFTQIFSFAVHRKISKNLQLSSRACL